jgi:hypothetical protein
MRSLKLFAATAVAGLCFAANAPKANAQVSVAIGVAPSCPYGYYDTAPYGCAPYGYYGPEWFSGGVFIGAGPCYHGPYPNHGDHAEHNVSHMENFHGNEMRDGHGHSGGGEHEGHH